ncbi:NADPH-dependent 2,4-dienoyl-CoA reductase [Lentzea sp. NBRC 105346]|uniref:oxidoreductase n=1 Tax=Lentzea sp. NBRC 105346 TaxID=3032205 RepID=UPI0024A11681|nr:FAD-dependent oxidoreductase [Lentzea sp. NBRC 105346]GLZ32262.1 NADPH-dependent 2,4-dienoyl-CoA reductase [Lentzea sp. NBRC 105346]
MLHNVFRAGAVGKLRLPNRIVMGAMHLNLERVDDGSAMAAFYAERARGGAGLIITGGCAVNTEGSGGPGYIDLSDSASHPALARWAAAVHGAGGRIALQLFHAGRYTDNGVAPSAVPSKLYSFGRELTGDEVLETIADFARGAELARELGFDAVEVMGSEGYLINQFLSPLTNLREDEWGDRSRVPLEIVRAIRAAVGDFPLLFRMSGDDLMPGSSTPADTLAFASALSRAGVDALNIGVGWHESRVPTVQSLVPQGMWVRYAAAVRSVVDIPVIASNRINTMALAESVLASGSADFVSMSRPFLADPAIVRKSLTGVPVNTCIGCNEACIDRSLGTSPVSCLVNPRAGRELEFPARTSARIRRFAVVGGGPSGLEAARALASLGHDVTLFEASPALGGQFRYAAMVPGKSDFGATIRYFTDELARLGVRVHLSSRVTTLSGFDGAVIATGVVPRELSLPGADLPHVVDYQQAFTQPLGPRVAIIGGGGIGVDVAHFLVHAPSSLHPQDRFLAENGLLDAPLPAPARQVTVLRRSGRIGDGMGRTTRWAAVASLRNAGVELLTGVSYEAITPAGVVLSDGRVIEADSVVVAAGQESRPAFPVDVPHRVIGGAADARGLNAVRAIEQGLRAAHDLIAATAATPRPPSHRPTAAAPQPATG